MANKNLIRLQGKVLVGVVNDDGSYGPAIYTGNAPNFKVTPKREVKEHRESTSGLSTVDERMETQTAVEISFTLDEFKVSNQELMLHGTQQAIVGATVTNEVFTGPTPKNGEIYMLAHRGGTISALAVHDSAGSPATLVLNTDYTFDPTFGYITILNTGSYVGPYKASYTYGASTVVPFYGTGNVHRYVILNGINTVSKKHVQLEIYCADVDPAKELDLLSDDFSKFEMSGVCLADGNKSLDPTLGPFGRIISID